MKTLLLFIALTASYAASSFEYPKDGAESAVPGSALAFRENRGQWEGSVLFRCTNGDFNISFLENRLVFGVRHMLDNGIPEPGAPPHAIRGAKHYFNSWVMHFEGADKALAAGLGKSEAKTNDFRGNQRIIGIRDFEQLSVRQLYPGVELFYRICDNKLKYDIRCSRAKELEQVKLRYEGIQELKVTEDGKLAVLTPEGWMHEQIPASFDSKGNPIIVRYRLLNDSTVGFELVSEVDPELPITVDPIYLDWSTYFYGNIKNNTTWVYDVETDRNDFAYLAGYTTDKFPGKAGIYDTTLNGGADAFICRMPIQGATIDYFTYIGGSKTDYAYGIACTEDGKAYITGITQSSDFPVSSSAYEKNYNGGLSYSGFITGLTSDGTSLIYSTFVGNSTFGTWSFAIDVNERGEVFIAPYTYGSMSVTHPMLPPGFVTNNPDCYILKFSAKGDKLIQSTRFGGDGFEYTMGIFVDRRDQVYIGGYTTSGNLPVTFGTSGFGGLFGGGYDGYIFKLDSGFTKWLVSKYINTTGNNFEYVSAITVNDIGEIFISGLTNGSDLPAKRNSPYPGGYNYFAMKMRADGIYPFWSTFIGPSFWSWRQRIAVSAQDELISTGNTMSATFPVTPDAYQKVLKGSYDPFVIKLDQNGYIKYASYFGGSSTDYMYASNVKRIGCVTHIIMAGYSASSDFPTLKAWKSTYNTSTGYWSGVVAKWRDTLKVADPNLGPDLTQCGRIFKFMDAGNKGASYRWGTGDTTRATYARKPGKYWVSVTYGCGYKYDTITFTLNYFPIPVSFPDTILCDKQTWNVDAKNDTIHHRQYLWSTNDTGRVLKIGSADKGRYWVTVNTKQCGSVTDTFFVTRLTTPLVKLGNDTITCMPGRLFLDAKNPMDSCKYRWSTGDTTRSIITVAEGKLWGQASNFCGVSRDTLVHYRDTVPTVDLGPDADFCDSVSAFISSYPFSLFHQIRWFNSDTSSSGFQITQPGTYWLSKKGKCGSATDTVRFTLYRTPKANLGNDTLLCNGASVLLRTAANPTASFSWIPAAGNSDSLRVSNAGRYIVQVKNQCGTAFDTAVISTEVNPTVNLPKDTLVCNLSSYQIIPVYSANAVSRKWDNADTTLTRTVGADGNFSIEVFNRCGSAKDNILVSFNESPTLSLPADETFCDQMPLRILDASGKGKNNTYAWSTGENSVVINAVSAGNYTCTVSNTCGTVSDAVTYKVVTSPVVSLGVDTQFCGRVDYPLTAPSGTGYTYLWNNGANTQSISANDFGPWKVTVTSPEGCTGSDEMVIFNSCNTRVFIPSAFTPDKDGLNETFKPVVEEVENYRLEIFNRWGEKIFFTEDPRQGWDGTYMGKQCMPGLYAYSLWYTGGYNRGLRKGLVQLIVK